MQEICRAGMAVRRGQEKNEDRKKRAGKRLRLQEILSCGYGRPPRIRKRKRADITVRERNCVYRKYCRASMAVRRGPIAREKRGRVDAKKGRSL